ncbi:hypothetical protein ACFVBP_28435 [Nocardioides sp. NPDC057764]|uniref:hypothetical protein n=1 Tax=Nocardioides sp. NPDC057764 TaxID=3346243 RepID=UPI0036703155
MATESVWIITSGPARGGTRVAFRSAEAAQDACEGFSAEFGFPVLEDWVDLSAAKDGSILVRYHECNVGGVKVPEEQRVERFPVLGSRAETA